MNFQERKNVIFRLVSGFLLLLSLGVSAFALSQVIITRPDEVPLLLIAISVVSIFAILEMIVILRGGRKESNLYKIAFNENGTINNIPLIAVYVGTGIGIGLVALGISVYCIRIESMIKCSMLVVVAISSYLLLNCLIYYIYVLMFKTREFNIKDLIK